MIKNNVFVALFSKKISTIKRLKTIFTIFHDIITIYQKTKLNYKPRKFLLNDTYKYRIFL